MLHLEGRLRPEVELTKEVISRLVTIVVDLLGTTPTVAICTKICSEPDLTLTLTIKEVIAILIATAHLQEAEETEVTSTRNHNASLCLQEITLLRKEILHQIEVCSLVGASLQEVFLLTGVRSHQGA
jgi:hypothetical protein